MHTLPSHVLGLQGGSWSIICEGTSASRSRLIHSSFLRFHRSHGNNNPPASLYVCARQKSIWSRSESDFALKTRTPIHSIWFNLQSFIIVGKLLIVHRICCIFYRDDFYSAIPIYLSVHSLLLNTCISETNVSNVRRNGKMHLLISITSQ